MKTGGTDRGHTCGMRKHRGVPGLADAVLPLIRTRTDLHRGAPPTLTAKAYESIDPAATLPVHTRLVEAELEHTGAQHYQRAARRLKRMRTLATRVDREHEVDALVAELREQHRRRPRLLQELDRAGM